MNKKLIEEDKKYKTSFQKLSRKDKLATLDTIELFLESMHHPNLRNHTLRNQLSSLKSITVHDDLRVLLRIRSDGSILLVDVGDHATVYRDM